MPACSNVGDETAGERSACDDEDRATAINARAVVALSTARSGAKLSPSQSVRKSVQRLLLAAVIER